MGRKQIGVQEMGIVEIPIMEGENLMQDTTTDFRLTIDGTITIPIDEYREFVARSVMLDMIMETANENGFVSSAVVKAIKSMSPPVVSVIKEDESNAQ